MRPTTYFRSSDGIAGYSTTWALVPDALMKEEEPMAKLQSQGVHHITLVGADRQTSVDFWQGVLGMPLVFEQPNLDHPEQNHL
jgi:hypothetical protein